ncbi:helix-turn-helix domain-containing protein, partial [Pseudomonas aeruginosa]
RETPAARSTSSRLRVSRFKLFEGFRRYFGVSPMSYLKHYRLAAVREEILASGGARSISTIALGWGFSHLGRFSVDYRKRFEETPSMTQRRAARRS